MKRMSEIFIKMGDTRGATRFGVTGHDGDWQTIVVNLNTAPDDELFPKGAKIRIIITPSDRYTPGIQRVFPVGGVTYEDGADDNNQNFTIRARNSDTAAGGGLASFFWLAIADNVGSRRSKGVGSVPMNQTFIGQPAVFAESNSNGDHQVLPSVFDPATESTHLGPYNFNNTFGTTAFPAPPSPNRPLVFVTGNNVGCGASPYLPPHNAAAVGLVQDARTPFDTTPFDANGFYILARNSDVAGLCGFNWVALQQIIDGKMPPGAPQQPANLLVDTGQFGQLADSDLIFNASGTMGDWILGEIQFTAPFAAEPVVLVTPRFMTGEGFGGPPNFGIGSCAPVGIVQNVTRFGFTMAARNSDGNMV
jgi:hypothetical protein